jgi:hypothetical protein
VYLIYTVAAPISDAVKDLNDDLMALIAEESIKQMSFGKSEPTSSPSTGKIKCFDLLRKYSRSKTGWIVLSHKLTVVQL